VIGRERFCIAGRLMAGGKFLKELCDETVELFDMRGFALCYVLLWRWQSDGGWGSGQGARRAEGDN